MKLNYKNKSIYDCLAQEVKVNMSKNLSCLLSQMIDTYKNTNMNDKILNKNPLW